MKALSGTVVVIQKSSDLLQQTSVRPASHYTILSLRRPAMAPHDAGVGTTSCSLRPSEILSAMILTIGGYHAPYVIKQNVQKLVNNYLTLNQALSRL